MSLTFYFAPMSSASPVSWAIAELGIPHEAVQFDLAKAEHKTPEYLAVNPMGQVPAIVDQGQAMFEGSAITVYLGETYGVEKGLWPPVGSAGHMQALTWVHWSTATLGAWIRIALSASGNWDPACKSEPLYLMAEGRIAAAVLAFEAHLSERDYITGSEFTLADAYVAATLWWGRHVKAVELGDSPHVEAWLEQCTQRPAARSM